MEKKKLIVLVSAFCLLVLGCVLYFVLSKSNTVKVTIANNVNDNLKKIEIQSGLMIKDIVPEEKEGYKFIKWTGIDGNEIENTKVITSNEKIYAVYEQINTTYTFTKFSIPSQKHQVINSNEQIIMVTNKMLPSDPNMETGGVVYEYTVKGLKTGKANITIELINTDGSKASSTTYYFEVDKDLNVKFLSSNEK